MSGIDCEMCGSSGVVESYGPFAGGDPRRFTPDEDDCTPEEIAAHKAACEAMDRGEDAARPPGCALMGDGSTWTGKGFGIGVNRWDCDHSYATETTP